MPKSYLSNEEKEEILSTMGENILYAQESKAAIKAGDEDASWQWLALTSLPAHSLSYLKKTKGTEFIKKYNFNTSEADKKFGKDWLKE